jgi:polysaccharide export outer membrane protein
MQIQSLQDQRPRIEAEVNAVASQIAKQKERLLIVNSRLSDLEVLSSKGLVTKVVLQNQQIEKSLVEGQIFSLQAQVANLRRNVGDLDIKLGEVKANYLGQILTELQDTSQRLREVDVSLGPTRRLLEVKAKAAGSDVDESEYTVRISRVRDGDMITFEATDDMMLAPGDVVEVKLKRHISDIAPSLSTQAMRELDPTSTLAEDIHPASR